MRTLAVAVFLYVCDSVGIKDGTLGLGSVLCGTVQKAVWNAAMSGAVAVGPAEAAAFFIMCTTMYCCGASADRTG